MRAFPIVLLALALLSVAAPTAYADDTQKHRRGPVRATILFEKNPSHPHRSRLTWLVERKVATPNPAGRRHHARWRTIERESWRAGSGYYGKGATDPCAKSLGWLPNGTYAPRQIDDYWGEYIRGPVLYLGTATCHDGTSREELFIHTETDYGFRPCPAVREDVSCRWQPRRYDEYASNGCIKMSPPAMRSLTRHYHRWFVTDTSYPLTRLRVEVRRPAPRLVAVPAR